MEKREAETFKEKTCDPGDRCMIGDRLELSSDCAWPATLMVFPSSRHVVGRIAGAHKVWSVAYFI